MAQIEGTVKGLDKLPQMVYDYEQQGCAANRQALTVPKQANPSKEDTMKRLARLLAVAALGCVSAPAAAEKTKYGFDCKDGIVHDDVCHSSPKLAEEYGYVGPKSDAPQTKVDKAPVCKEGTFDETLSRCVGYKPQW